MSIEKHPTIDNLYRIRYYPDGRKKDPKTGKASNKRETVWFEGNEAAAMDYYAALMRQSKGVDLLIAPTFAKAWSQFCPYYKNKTSSTTYNDFLKTWNRHLLPFFGKYKPHQLTQTIIEQYKSKRLQETYLPGKNWQRPEDDQPGEAALRRPISRKRINNELYYVSAMATWMALPEVRYANPLPFKIHGFPAKDVKAPLPVVPDRREVIMLLRAAERNYRPMLCIWYYGGLRKTEVLFMTGERVNLSQGYMIVLGKGHKERIVPIHRKIRVYLRKHWRQGHMWTNPKTEKPYVFLTRALRRAAERAGFDKRLYIHLLRHAFGTHSIQSGVNPRALQMLLGHESLKTTEIYSTLAAGHLAIEIEKLGTTSKKEEELLKLLQEVRGALHHIQKQKRAEETAS